MYSCKHPDTLLKHTHTHTYIMYLQLTTNSLLFLSDRSNNQEVNLFSNFVQKARNPGINLEQNQKRVQQINSTITDCYNYDTINMLTKLRQLHTSFCSSI